MNKQCDHSFLQGSGSMVMLMSAWTFGEIIEEDGKYFTIMVCMNCDEEAKDPTTKEHYDAYTDAYKDRK